MYLFLLILEKIHIYIYYGEKTPLNSEKKVRILTLISEYWLLSEQ